MKPVPLYALMVGVPLAILVPALSMGRGLSAPPAVAGEWQAGDGGRLRIAQSGVFLQLELRELDAAPERMAARLSGDSLVTGGSPCAGAPRLSVRFAPGSRPTTALARERAADCTELLRRLVRTGGAR